MLRLPSARLVRDIRLVSGCRDCCTNARAIHSRTCRVAGWLGRACNIMLSWRRTNGRTVIVYRYLFGTGAALGGAACARRRRATGACWHLFPSAVVYKHSVLLLSAWWRYDHYGCGWLYAMAAQPIFSAWRGEQRRAVLSRNIAGSICGLPSQFYLLALSSRDANWRRCGAHKMAERSTLCKRGGC